MGVVPWSDRYNTDKKDMSLEVNGQEQNEPWRDIIGDDLDSCKVILRVRAGTAETTRTTTAPTIAANGPWSTESEFMFRGNDSCYQAFQAKVNCGCTKCEFWTR